MEGITNTSKLEDKLLRFLECGVDFTFTIGEQRYFLSKGLSIPKRCLDAGRSGGAAISSAFKESWGTVAWRR